VHEYNPTFVIIRQSGCTNFEKPFLYLLFGSKQALLVDTGATGARISDVVDEQLRRQADREKIAPLPLLVVHSHGHGDHTAGDDELRRRPATTLIEARPEAVSTFFGLQNWPQKPGDHGDRSGLASPIRAKQADGFTRLNREGHIVDGRCLLCRTGNSHVCPYTKIIGVDRDGCFAEYIAMPATNVWHLDDNVSFDIGGIHDPMGNAFHTALTADIPGATVLVTGCGPIGIFAVGICKAAGASRIIASDINDTRLALAKQMGASDIVHPSEASEVVKRHTDGLGVDVVLEMSGVPAAIHQAFDLVRVGGRVQMLGIPSKPMDVNFATEIIFKGLTIYGVVGRRMYDTWLLMTRFLRSGQFDPTPVITHRFPLEGAEEAIRAIKSGEAGKVIFEIA